MNTARWIYKDCKTPIYKDYLKNEHNKPIQKKD
jgi:hypothetical protein